MTLEQIVAIVRRKYDAADGCASCGWKAALGEYGILEEWVEWDSRHNRIVLPCLSKDDEDSFSHRGVRIYLTAEDLQP